MIRAEFAGAAAPELVVACTVLHFTADRYSMVFNGVEADAGSYVAEGDAATRMLTLQADKGPHTGRVVCCIYQLVGDRLRICYGLDGRTPTQFTTQADEPHYLATYRRCTEERDTVDSSV
ncbi:hypothetical protein Oter_2403 [Opitutus terrae PB90-1]|uniref:Uncharacterized protein n=2 Tax=Opitutus terrae TaxID=107709 RepID=B1ZS86_OPITP|nr:hypothetical protein Oter_2403 [Opitutus terrae PB90-1]